MGEIKYLFRHVKFTFGRKSISKTIVNSSAIPTTLPSTSVILPTEDISMHARAQLSVNPIPAGQLMREAKILTRFEAKEALQRQAIYLGRRASEHSESVSGLNKLKLDLSQANTHNFLGNSQLYVFYKEKGFICYDSDPEKRNRPTVFEVLKHRLDIKQKFFIIGRLDYNAEGIILFTNNPEVQQVWIKNQNNFSYTYLVKVFGRFDDNILARLRQGSLIKKKTCGPFFCEVKRSLTSSTILLMKNNSVDMRDVKLILQKNNLRIASLRRTHFGPYVLGNLQQGHMTCVDFDNQFKRHYFEHKRNLLKLKKEELEKRLHQIQETKETEHNIKYLNASLFTSALFSQTPHLSKREAPS